MDPRQALDAAKALGLTLMLHPYLSSQTWAIYAVGMALCAGLWIERRL